VKFLLGAELRCDLQVLVDTRILVQANSGGGKSHTLRRILEQTHGHVQQLIIDPEGEFASLRERYDYVLAAKQGGDTAADPRSAKLLAERLLELGVSAILDVYELKAHERIRFVRLFLEALIDAKKTLWHPALVVVDEAHVYCPQQGEAESAGAVIDLATRGRKRGFCAMLATQRLSKLHKDAAAELNNKLIGRTGLDIDRKRAAEELGFTTREESLQLRSLERGEFFAFGPALSTEVKRITVGPVQTRHPKAGARLATIAPPPTEKVKALLPKLADLPAEAEQRTRTLQELQRDNATLRGQLTRLERAAPTRVETKVETRVQKVEIPVLKDGQVQRLERAATKLADAGVAVTTIGRELVETLKKFHANGKLTPPGLQTSGTPRAAVAPQRTTTHHAPPRPTPPADGEFRPSSSQQRILNALAWLEVIGLTPANKNQLAFLAGQRSTSGGYFNNLGALRSAGLIAYPQAGTVELKLLTFVRNYLEEATYDAKGYPIQGQVRDFYQVPGAGETKALTKRGAEKLATLFRFGKATTEIVARTETAEYVSATVQVTLVDQYRRPIGSAVSSCSTAEAGFRSVFAQKKYGAKIAKEKDCSFVVKTPGDFRAALNDVVARASKRAFVQAVIVATAADEVFIAAEEAEAKAPDPEEEKEPVVPSAAVRLPDVKALKQYAGKVIAELPSDALIKIAQTLRTKTKNPGAWVPVIDALDAELARRTDAILDTADDDLPFD